jgi:ATP-dependent Clp protease ATP-binding subunit ClpC
MEDGSLADAKGRKVDFRNTIIIMTGNIGAEEISRNLSIGFTVYQDDDKKRHREYEVMRDKVMSRLKQTFRPEFLNRIDGVMVFHSLQPEEIRQIVNLELDRVRKQLAEQEISLDVTIEAMDLLGERGYDHTYGARPVRRIIQNLIEDPLAEGLLDNSFQAGDTVRVEVHEGTIKLEKVRELVPA